jgi:hypothetical protein
MAVLTETMDAEVLGNGWMLAASVDYLRVAPTGDMLLVGAVAWSGWDRQLLRYLANARRGRSPRVLVFNFDEADETTLSRLVGGRSWSPYQPPLMASLQNGAVQRLEQGWLAVEWGKSITDDS